MRTIAQHLLPHKLISLIARLCADCTIVFIKNYLISNFVKKYPVKMQEAIQENPLGYPTYNDFFTRALKPGIRPIDQNPNSIVSPADGLVAQLETIDGKQLIQAKGRKYSVTALLGSKEIDSNSFTDGIFSTIYLAPHDYHRVHIPLAGKLEQMHYIPGKLFSVNMHAANNIDNLFARNERIVTIFNTQFGKMAVVLVGAMIVGGIETTWQGIISPPHHKQIISWQYKDKDIYLNKGDELGRFRLGSTVIVLWQKNNISLDTELRGEAIKVGQRMGILNAN